MPVAANSPCSTSFSCFAARQPTVSTLLSPCSNVLTSANHRQTPSQPNSLDTCRSPLGVKAAKRIQRHKHSSEYLFIISLRTALSFSRYSDYTPVRTTRNQNSISGTGEKHPDRLSSPHSQLRLLMSGALPTLLYVYKRGYFIAYMVSFLICADPSGRAV